MIEKRCATILKNFNFGKNDENETRQCSKHGWGERDERKNRGLKKKARRKEEGREGDLWKMLLSKKRNAALSLKTGTTERKERMKKSENWKRKREGMRRNFAHRKHGTQRWPTKEKKNRGLRNRDEKEGRVEERCATIFEKFCSRKNGGGGNRRKKKRKRKMES